MRKFFEFQNAAKIICGDAALKTIGKELSSLGASKPMLLTSANAAKLGVKEKVKSTLLAEAFSEPFVPESVPQTIDLEYAKKQKNAYISERCDSIVAVGGDEVMDTAKVIKLLLSQDWDEILPIATECVAAGKDVPLIAIPSENGSGKEANGYVEVGEYYISSPALVPSVVIIDEDVAMAAPTREIAACGAYALANAIEGYIEAEETGVSDVYAEKSIRLLSKNLLKAVADSQDEEACRATALAATLGGVAYGATPYGAAHALAEGMSEVTKEPLEEMFALTIVPSVKKALEKSEEKIKNVLYLLEGADVFAETPASERAERAIASVQEILDKLHEYSGLATKISETKIRREDFGLIAEAATNKRASITAFGPLSKDEFLEMLNNAF